jgi:hypothetical protein
MIFPECQRDALYGALKSLLRSEAPDRSLAGILLAAVSLVKKASKLCVAKLVAMTLAIDRSFHQQQTPASRLRFALTCEGFPKRVLITWRFRPIVVCLLGFLHFLQAC